MMVKKRAFFLRWSADALGCIDIEGWLATEGIFVQFAERGVADIGHILATSDKEMGKKAPVPQGWERKALRHGFGRLSIEASFRSQRRPFLYVDTA